MSGQRIAEVGSDPANYFQQLVPVALPLVVGAMAHERDGPRSAQLLEQAERELLAVILDRAAARIDEAAHEQLAAIFAKELRPADPARQNTSKQPFTRPK